MELQEEIQKLQEQLTHKQAKQAQAEAEVENRRNQAEAEAAEHLREEGLRVNWQENRAQFLEALGPAADNPEVWIDLILRLYLDRYQGDPANLLREVRRVAEAVNLQAAYMAAHPVK